MVLFETILLLVVAVLLSALISQLTSQIASPIIQIVIGIVLALFLNEGADVVIEPELLLLLFIAPLLFNEAQKINKLEFWKNKGMVLSLAVVLVIITTLCVGFTLNIIVPSIGLALAFALGATLGPTDAVAVSSMSGVAKLSKKQKVILAGESLINDASGLVAFQFAVAAAVTGSFSLADASKEFVVLFFGGILCGIISAFVMNFFIAFIRNRGFENNTFQVLFEVAVPFLVFLLAERLHVSGVLAVVACGLIFSSSYGQAGVSASKNNILSSSVWEVIAFALNGIVFVLLGMMLPGGMEKEMGDGVTSINYELIGVALLLTVVVIGIRFLWCLFIERVFGSAEEINKGLVKHSAILSFSGAKGAITMSMIMAIPYSIAERSELIFMASIVILMTLLLANFFIPLIAPSPEEDINEKKRKEQQYYLKSLRYVAKKLTVEMDESENVYEKAAYQSVLAEYTDRINSVLQGLNPDTEEDNGKNVELRLEAIKWQKQYAKTLQTMNEYSADVVNVFISECEELEDVIESDYAVVWNFHKIVRRLRILYKTTVKSMRVLRAIDTYIDTEFNTDMELNTERAKKKQKEKEKSTLVKKLRLECQEYVISRATDFIDKEKWKAEEIAALVNEYQQTIMVYQTQQLSFTKMIYSKNRAKEIKMTALAEEHDCINSYYKQELIDRKTVNKLRRKIAAMQIDLADDI